MTEQPSLIAQYRDCLAIIDRRLAWLRRTLTLTNSDHGDRFGPVAGIARVVVERVDALSTAGLPLISSDSNGSLGWYLKMEVRLDKNAGWRIACAIERLGVRVLAPVKVILPEDVVRTVRNERSLNQEKIRQLSKDGCEMQRRVVDRLSVMWARGKPSVMQLVGEELAERLVRLTAPTFGLTMNTILSLREAAIAPDLSLCEDIGEPEVLLTEGEEWLYRTLDPE